MRKIISLFLLFIILLIPASGRAFDFDDLFGDDLLQEFDESESVLRPEDILLVSEGIEVGGNYQISSKFERVWLPGKEPKNEASANFNSQIFWDFRPDPNFRVFAKGDVGLKIARDDGDKFADPLQLNMNEFFADFNYDNRVFFRAGKQNVKWGVGYFFSPADVVNQGRIDPQEPEAARGGTVALKAHYPFKSNNLYLYTIFSDLEKPDEIAIAPKVEYVVGKSEMGLGGFYQKGKSPLVMATISSSLGQVSLFAEAALGWNSQYLDFKAVDLSLPGIGSVYELVEREGPYFKATAGGLYTYENITGALQYYFNGEGYREQELLKKLRKFVFELGGPPTIKGLGEENVHLLNQAESGRHYLAANLIWSDIAESKISGSTTLLVNLSDQSGVVSNTLSLPSWGNIRPSLGVTANFGKEGTQYGLMGKTYTVFAAITLGSGSF